MSRTVCSWCKAPFVLKDDILVCSNTDCLACDEKYLHEELIRTRKALDVAVDALKDNLSQANFREMLDASRFHCIRTKSESALAEITALKQKDKQ